MYGEQKPQFNPYVPLMDLDMAALATVSSKEVKRPISVWLMQLILYISVGLIAIGFFKGMRELINHGVPDTGLWRVLVSILCLSALIVGGVWTAIALYRRRSWSRWVSLLLLTLFLAFIIFRKDTTYYANDAQRIGGFIGRYVVFSVLLIWWAYAIAFSNKAKRYFETGSSI